MKINHAARKAEKLKEEVNFWRSLLLYTSEAVVFTDSHGKILFLNPAAKKFLGYFEKTKKKSILDFANGNKEEIVEKLTELKACKTLKNLRLSFKTKENSDTPVLLTIDMVNGKKKTEGILWIIQDLSAVSYLEKELKITIAKLEEETKKDYLTGIFNRRYFDRILEHEIEQAKRFNHSLALVFLDIDGFKNKVNDKYGHHIGDEVIVKVTAVVGSIIRKSDVLARWGGEEFVVICPETDSDGALTLAEKIRKTVEETEIIIRNGEKVGVTVSVGVANFIPNGTKEGVIKKANLAMHYAKNSGRNRIWHAAWPIDKEG